MGRSILLNRLQKLSLLVGEYNKFACLNVLKINKKLTDFCFCVTIKDFLSFFSGLARLGLWNIRNFSFFDYSEKFFKFLSFLLLKIFFSKSIFSRVGALGWSTLDQPTDRYRLYLVLGRSGRNCCTMENLRYFNFDVSKFFQ